MRLESLLNLQYMQIIDSDLLDKVSAEAKESARLRMN